MEKPSLDTAKAGAMRFNTDSSQMEIYDGNQWTGILATSPELETGGTRGVWAGGFTEPPNNDIMDFINIETTGNFVDFGGDLQNSTTIGGSLSSRNSCYKVSGFCCGGDGNVNLFTIGRMHQGNASDFADLTYLSKKGFGLSNQLVV